MHTLEVVDQKPQLKVRVRACASGHVPWRRLPTDARSSFRTLISSQWIVAMSWALPTTLRCVIINNACPHRFPLERWATVTAHPTHHFRSPLMWTKKDFSATSLRAITSDLRRASTIKRATTTWCVVGVLNRRGGRPSQRAACSPPIGGSTIDRLSPPISLLTRCLHPPPPPTAQGIEEMAREGDILTVAQQGIYRQINLVTGNILSMVDCGVPRPIVKWIQHDTVTVDAPPLRIASLMMLAHVSLLFIAHHFAFFAVFLVCQDERGLGPVC